MSRNLAELSEELEALRTRLREPEFRVEAAASQARNTAAALRDLRDDLAARKAAWGAQKEAG